MIAKREVRVGRIYDPPSRRDGTRVLVDRIWPRGVSKDKAAFDGWCKQIAPSTDLRVWYGHDPARFAEFRRRYRAELADPDRAEVLKYLQALVARGTLTLLTATKQVEISAAVVLADLLQR